MFRMDWFRKVVGWVRLWLGSWQREEEEEEEEEEEGEEEKKAKILFLGPDNDTKTTVLKILRGEMNQPQPTQEEFSIGNIKYTVFSREHQFALRFMRDYGVKVDAVVYLVDCENYYYDKHLRLVSLLGEEDYETNRAFSLGEMYPSEGLQNKFKESREELRFLLSRFPCGLPLPEHVPILILGYQGSPYICHYDDQEWYWASFLKDKLCLWGQLTGRGERSLSSIISSGHEDSPWNTHPLEVFTCHPCSDYEIVFRWLSQYIN